MHKLTFRTKRLIIRPLQISDYDIWKSTWLNLPPTKNVWDNPPRLAKNLTLAKYKKYLNRQKVDRNKDYFYDFAVFLKSGEFIGFVSVMDVTRKILQSAYLGYRIFNPYWGKGYAKEAVRKAYEIAFKNLSLHRLEAGIEPTNKRSLALAQSLKLRHEGCKKRALFLRNKWVDLEIYTLTCEDLGIRFRGPKPIYKKRN